MTHAATKLLEEFEELQDVHAVLGSRRPPRGSIANVGLTKTTRP
jgi:hypothetical protein